MHGSVDAGAGKDREIESRKQAEKIELIVETPRHAIERARKARVLVACMDTNRSVESLSSNTSGRFREQAQRCVTAANEDGPGE